MEHRPPPKFVWFLLAGATITLVASRVMPSIVVSGINSVAVARLLLWLSFGMFAETLLEVAILNFPSLTGSRSILFGLLLVLLLAAGWVRRVGVSDATDHSPPKPRDILSHIFSGDDKPATQSELPLRPAGPPPAENLPDDNPRPLPTTENPAPESSDQRSTTLASSHKSDNATESNHQPPPVAAPPKLPSISLTQRNTIRDAMRPYAGLRFTLLSESPTKDSRDYAAQIESALTGAGLIDSGQRETFPDNGRNNPPGLSLVVGSKELDAASDLSSAMRRAGLTLWSLPMLETSNPDTFQLIVAPN